MAIRWLIFLLGISTLEAKIAQGNQLLKTSEDQPGTLALAKRSAIQARSILVSFLDIHIRSEACDDPGKASGTCGIAYIRVNGKDHSPHGRGHNVVIVDAKTGCSQSLYVCEKLKATNVNPYIINWIISFLGNRKQRVVVDGKITDYVDINRGVPQGTVLGPLLFSLMVNDIKLVDSNNGISKYADDITISVPVRRNSDTALAEVKNLESWAANNRMSLNLSKTWEMLLHSRTTQPAPPPVLGIERKEWLKLLGITFHEDPCAVLGSKSFDTYGISSAGVALRDYLNAINGDKIVLVAIQDAGSKYVSPAINALKRLGAMDPILKDFRVSFALVGYAHPSKPSWIVQEQQKRYEGPSEIFLRIPLKQSSQPRKKIVTSSVNSSDNCCSASYSSSSSSSL
ncbi:hypothetical protein ACROYT_G016170 [Oculina patagonica]